MSVTDQIRIYRWMHHVNWSEKSIIQSTAWRCWGSHKYLIFVCKGCLIYLVPGLFVFLCRWFLSPEMIPTRPPCWVSRLYTVCLYVVQTLSWEREFYVWTIEIELVWLLIVPIFFHILVFGQGVFFVWCSV